MTRRARAALTLACLAATGSAVAVALGAPSLSAPVVVGLGAPGDAVAVGDVTGDGRADVVVTTGYSGDPSRDFRLVVVAQAPGGSLLPPVSYATAGTYGSRPASVAIGDLTGDGKPDVVVGLQGLGVQVFPQVGGALGAPSFTATADSGKVALGRLDGDADLDVASLGWGTNTVSVMANDGSGNLSAPIAYPALHGGYDDLEIGDVTGDGRSDIVVMSGQLYAAPNVSVVAQTATGFAAPVEYRVGTNVLTQGIGVGDVTGDGRSDVIVSYGGNSPGASIAVLAQTAGGALAPPLRYPSYDIPEPVAVADIDLDGRQDVVTLHGGWSAAGVYAQQPGGGLGVEQRFPIPYASHYNPHGLAVGDVDGNGMPDVAIGDSNNGLVVLRNGGVPPSADRAVALTPSSATVKQRRAFWIDVRVSNTGPSTSAAAATLTLTGAVDAVSVSTQGCAVVSRTVTCQFASLASGGSVTVRVSGTAGGRGTISAGAQVSGSPADPNPSNDTATTSIAVR